MSRLNRREAIKRLLEERGDLVVVAGLGAPAYDVAAAGDSPLDFPLWGAMGGAVMVGLGLAIAQPARTILVITGDGEMLMGVGSLATVAVARPPNLRIVVLDNERFGETGNQRTHTAAGVSLVEVAKGCGIADARLITTMPQIERLREELVTAPGVIVAVVKIGAEVEPKALPPRDGPYLAHRTRAALLGDVRAREE